MDEIFKIFFAGVGGLIFSITPIPHMPFMFFWEVKKIWKEDQSMLWIILFTVFNFCFALLPLIFIGGVINTSGVLAGAAFTLAMYYPVYGVRNKEEK